MVALKSGPVLVAGMSTGKSPILADGHWMPADETETKTKRSSSTASQRSKVSTPKARRHIGTNPRPIKRLESEEDVPRATHARSSKVPKSCLWPSMPRLQSLEPSTIARQADVIWVSQFPQMEASSPPRSQSDWRSDDADGTSASHPVAMAVIMSDPSEASSSYASLSPHSDWRSDNTAMAGIHSTSSDGWPTDAYEDTARHIGSGFDGWMDGRSQHDVPQSLLSTRARPTHSVVGVSYQMGTNESMRFAASNGTASPCYLGEIYDERCSISTDSPPSESSWLAVPSHPAASFTLANANASCPSLSYAWPVPSTPEEALLPHDPRGLPSDVAYCPSLSLDTSANASDQARSHTHFAHSTAQLWSPSPPVFAGRAADEAPSWAHSSQAAAAQDGNKSVSGIAQLPIYQRMQGTSRGLCGESARSDMHGIPGGGSLSKLAPCYQRRRRARRPFLPQSVTPTY
jgi:hypothetical protein